MIVETRSGRLQGRKENGICVFRGIPYAAPPVGPLRWRPPASPEPWTGVRDAFDFGAAGLQGSLPAEAGPLADLMAVPEAKSESCLYLNVWTPSVEGSRPVMVWIHGGGFASGSGGQKGYSGQNLCGRNLVVVTINYRLGPLGVAHLAGPTSGAIPATGNESLLDQVAALEWVRDNAATFGGDPNCVTIIGESTGSACVATLMAMPAAKGLFHRAIAQSSGGHLAHSVDDSVRWFTEPMLERLGTRDAEALMQMPADKLFAAFPDIMESGTSGDLTALGRYPGQVLDGEVLPALPADAFASGSAEGVPFLSGNSRDEGLIFAPLLAGQTEAGLAELLAPGLPTPLKTEALIQTYREARGARGARTDVVSLLCAMATDRYEIVPTDRMLVAQSAHAPTFRYVFDWVAPFGDGVMGATHGVSGGFTFGNLDVTAPMTGRGPAAAALADAVMDAWAAFARTGNPSSPGLGEWPVYDAATRPTMMIGPNVHVAEDPMGAERRAWDAVPSSSPAFKTNF